jgi:uncharacterized protein (TIGR02265 family)
MTEKLLKREVIEAMLMAANLKEDAVFNEIVKNEIPDFAELMAQPELPLETVNKIQSLTAKYVFPDKDATLALWELGKMSFEGFRQTNIGKILLAALSVWGAERTMKNIPQVFNGVVRYGTRTVNRLDENYYELILEDMPNHFQFIAGIIERALELSGAEDVHISISTGSKDAARLEFSWQTASGLEIPYKSQI